MNPSQYRTGTIATSDSDDEFFLDPDPPGFAGYHRTRCGSDDCLETAKFCLNPTVLDEGGGNARIKTGIGEVFLCEDHIVESMPMFNPIKLTHDKVIDILLKYRIDPNIVAEVSDEIEGLLDKEDADATA